MSNSVRFTASLDDNVSKKLGLIGQKFDKTFGKGSSASLFGNVGAKAIGVGFGLIASAASNVVDVLGSSITAFIEEEQSIAKLDSALRANVKGWDGQTAAIEAVLESRMRLGFSDDEQRASLALLVVATNDTTRALEIQRAAMDLARLKGISLEDATKALIKVDGGMYRELKALGIQLPINATQQDALNAVMLAATGQADAYANTTGGKLLASQIKVNEAMEKLGAVIGPPLVGFLTALTDEWLPALGRGWDKVTGFVEGVNDAVNDFTDSVQRAIHWIEELLSKIITLDRYEGVGLPNSAGVPGHAEGGWVGLRGPEMAIVGERGPEYITPNHALGMRGDGRSRDSHGHAIIIDGRQLAQLIDERFAQKQRRMPARQGV